MPASNDQNRSSGAKLPTTAIIIGLVSLFSDISTEMSYPLLPFFVTTVLHATPRDLGLIEGIAEGTASLITGFSGWISDFFQRRKSIALFGYGLTALAKPMIALAGGVPLVIAGRFLDRFGKGVRSAPKDTLLANVATPETRGRIFGFERMMDSAGAVLGPGLALLLFYYLKLDLRVIFLLTIVPSLLALMLLFLVKEDGAAESKPRKFSLSGLSREYWLFLAINTVFNLGNSSNAFLLLKASDIGMGLFTSLACYMLYNAIYSFGSYPAGIVSDRLGRRNILLVGFLIFAIVYCGFAMAHSQLSIWLLFAAYGIYPALTDGVSKAFAVDLTTPEVRATAIGLFAAALGLSRIPASYIGGVLYQEIGSAATFYFGAVMALIAFVLLWVCFPVKNKS